jgi:predicted transcriptional regulator
MARVVTLLAGIRETTAAEIERRAGMRQSDVSSAMEYRVERELIRARREASAGTGRPVTICGLATPLPEIISQIQLEKHGG